MMTRTFAAAAIIGGSLLLGSLRATGGPTPVGDLTQRVTELEMKVAKIERLLLAKSLSPANTVAEAELRLVAAEEQLRYSERLHEKGFVTKIQRDADKLLVVMAQKQLELAKGANTDISKVLEIDVLEAEHYLSLAAQRLKYTQRLATKGYATELQVKTDKFAVEKARKELDRAKAKLKAHQRSSPDNKKGD